MKLWLGVFHISITAKKANIGHFQEFGFVRSIDLDVLAGADCEKECADEKFTHSFIYGKYRQFKEFS
jgi:hypothetical protein